TSSIIFMMRRRALKRDPYAIRLTGRIVIEAVLNHVSGHRAGVAGGYNRSAYTRDGKNALAIWADPLARNVRGEGTENLTVSGRDRIGRKPRARKGDVKMTALQDDVKDGTITRILEDCDGDINKAVAEIMRRDKWLIRHAVRRGLEHVRCGVEVVR